MRNGRTYPGVAGDVGVMVADDSVWVVVGQERESSVAVATAELSRDEAARLAADLAGWLSTRP